MIRILTVAILSTAGLVSAQTLGQTVFDAQCARCHGIGGTGGEGPSLQGATNWFSPSYSPGTGLLYVAVREMGSIYFKTEAEYSPARISLEAGSKRFRVTMPPGLSARSTSRPAKRNGTFVSIHRRGRE